LEIINIPSAGDLMQEISTIAGALSTQSDGALERTSLASRRPSRILRLREEGSAAGGGELEQLDARHRDWTTS
jgi:hypothetical protein